MSAPEQLVLISEPGVRHDSPDTSRVAAESVARTHSGRLLRIQQIVDDAGPWGATADEVWQRAVLEESKRPTRSTWHGAVSAAAKAGLIVPNGCRRISIHGVVMAVYIHPRHQ